MSDATAIRLQGSQAALVTLAARERERAVAAAEDAFRGAIATVLREHGVAAAEVAPDPATGGWWLLVAPDDADASARGRAGALAQATMGDWLPTMATATPVVRRRFVDASAMTPDEAARYEALRAQALAPVADAPRGPTGPELLAANRVDYGAFGG